MLAAVYKEKGLAGWYQGLGAQITKAVLCQGEKYTITLQIGIMANDTGILFVSKDQFEVYASLILESLAGLKARV